ncbi:MAG: hypothetical protein HKM24_07945 [Gammaproteobacteria bacterium]|nr:hypothetical protein [Gammaproteobacteria bacterium]
MIYMLVYAVVMIIAALIYECRRQQSVEHFFVANRSVSGWLGALSVAASWVWAPALFVSTQVGYQWGYSGLFWFVLPNMVALASFSLFAKKVREKLPQGFSYIEFIQNINGGFRNTQLTIQLIVQMVAFAIQVTAGAELLSLVADAPFHWVVVVMTLGPLAYSLIAGLSSSVFTDAIQYLIIVCTIGLIFLGFPEWQAASQSGLRSFDPFESNLMWQFGLASALTLVAGIFADHQQWQRAFAIKSSAVARTYVSASFLHGLVTFSLGTFGLLLFGIGFDTDNTKMVGVEFITNDMHLLFSVAFTFMALCGLCSTLDSCFCAFSSLISTEVIKTQNRVKTARWAMVILAIIGLMIGLSRTSVITLWMLAGVLRLICVFPTMWSITGKNFNGHAGSAAIIIGAMAGGPLFVYSSYHGLLELRTVGMILCIAVSGLVCLVAMMKSHFTVGWSLAGRIKSADTSLTE